MTLGCLQDIFRISSGYLQDIFRMSLGQDGFRMTQKVLRRLSESDQRAREQSDFIIPSESKILRLVGKKVGVWGLRC